MTNALDNAVAAIQNHVSALTSVTFKSAQDYAVENADPFPMSVAYCPGGTFTFTNASVHHNFPTIRVEMHFSRVNLKLSQQQINAAILEFPKRLAGDPALGGAIDTIVASRDNPITYTVTDFNYGKIQSRMLMWDIPVKTLQAPI